MFARWHAEPGVRAYVFGFESVVVGYGEIWEDPEENEAELARLIVEPGRRGSGLGRRLVRELLTEARRLGWSNVWLWVVPDNQPALRAYAAAGFTRATHDQETEFNVGQPVEFVWMRAPAPEVP